MAKNTLFDKIWNLHKITTIPNGHDQLFIGRLYMHEVTTPQAFAAIREKGTKVAFPERVFATIDHVNPTHTIERPYVDKEAELMAETLEKNAAEFGIKYFGEETGRNGIVHIIGPELGLTQPGMTIVCGDSHTATHGAFGSIAFGIGTTEVQTVLETQTLALKPLKVRKININGELPNGVYAKDIILKVIQVLGVNGGVGYAYEFTGSTIEALSMEERMVITNMGIEGGARVAYMNPDEKTIEYLRGREYSPKGEDFDKAVDYWKSIASSEDAEYDDIVDFDATTFEPMVTWGTTPGHAIEVTGNTPSISDFVIEEQKNIKDALAYMKFNENEPMAGKEIDVVFIGSCTNGRLGDFREAAKILEGKKVKEGLKVLIVPGSQLVKKQVEAEGLDKIFKDAGAEWRFQGCSMCLAMNPDKLIKDQLSASTSNRNFVGRQGSPIGRTILMSPAMAAAAAITGKITDVRSIL